MLCPLRERVVLGTKMGIFLPELKKFPSWGTESHDFVPQVVFVADMLFFSYFWRLPKDKI